MRAGSSRWLRLSGPGLVLLAAAVAVAPQLVRGNSCGHDFDFHLVSWLDCVNAWRHGLVYPHWSPSANYGAGEPRFVFYPPLTWMLGAALGLVLPWVAVPVVLTFVLLAGTGLATRALARELLPERLATLAGCAALLSGYALFTAYERAAFGEMAGGVWMPLLLLFALRERRTEAGVVRRALDGSAAWLAVVVAGAWLSNAPVGVMACYLLAAVAVAAAVLRRSWAPLVRALVAVALGLGLAAVYVIPAAVEQGWVAIRQATDDPGLAVENSWLFARHNTPLLEQHDIELLRVSAIAVVMVAAALGCLLIALARRRVRGNLGLRRSWWIPLALIPVAVLLLQLPFSAPVWHLLPRLRFLQFPWRWLVVLEAPLGILFALAGGSLWLGSRTRRTILATACGLGFLLAVVLGGGVFFQICDEEDRVWGMLDTYHAGAGFEGVDEYAPPGAENGLVAMGLPGGCLVADANAVLGVGAESTVPTWDAGQGSCAATLGFASSDPEHLRLSAIVPRAGFLILRLRSYPAWRVRVNGEPAAQVAGRGDGLMAVRVPQGAVEVAVDWGATPDVVAGRWVSALSLLLAGGLAWVERRRFR